VNRTAYLVVFLEAGTGKFKGAGIYSEPGHSLTMDGSKTMPATVFECGGVSYSEASKAILANCRMYKHMQWLIPHLEAQGAF